MRQPLRPSQFHLVHLLVAMTVVAMFIQPARVAYRWLTAPPVASTCVSVPSGGTLVISGIRRHPDGTFSNKGGGVNRLIKPPSKDLLMMATPPIIIQPEFEEDTEPLLLSPSIIEPPGLDKNRRLNR